MIVSSQEEAGRRGVYSPQDLYTFPATQLRGSSTLKVNIRNSSADMHEVRRGKFMGSHNIMYRFIFFFLNPVYDAFPVLLNAACMSAVVDEDLNAKR